MTVTLIASNAIQTDFVLEDTVFTLRDMIERLGMSFSDAQEESDAERLAEFAGRTCYQSYGRPNPSTADTADYVKNIIAQQHESVFEHAYFTFYVDSFSRNMLLELERHRHLSFSVISQRFVNSENANVIVPPALWDVTDDEFYGTEWDRVEAATKIVYTNVVSMLQGKGLTRKQAREAARGILPGNTETKFVVSGNARAWRDVLKKRYSKHADAEICAFATQVLGLLRQDSPALFQDFPEEPFE